MSKYEPLARYLKQVAADRLRLTFSEIQTILEFPLPRSAKLYYAWWSNNGLSHAQADAWLSAGFETSNVNLKAGQIAFVRLSAKPRGFAEDGQPRLAEGSRKFAPGAERGKMNTDKAGAKLAGIEVEDLDGHKVIARHPAFGSMKGTSIVMPGVDLTTPADPDWGKVYDQDYFDEVIEGPRRTTETGKPT